MRLQNFIRQRLHFLAFPFLLGRAFIEAASPPTAYPSRQRFPFLLGRAFIEAPHLAPTSSDPAEFPFLFGGTFIKDSLRCSPRNLKNYSQLLVGTFNKTDQYPPDDHGTVLFCTLRCRLSLRPSGLGENSHWPRISLPFWRGFH